MLPSHKVLCIQLKTDSEHAEIVSEIDFTIDAEIGKQYKCTLAGYQFSINKSDYPKIVGLKRDSNVWTMRADESAIRAAFEKLRSIVASGGDGMIQVRSCGKGPTEKSCRVIVEAVTHMEPGHREDRAVTGEHRLLIPVSWKHKHGRKSYVARWRLNRAIHEKVLKGEKWPTDIAGGIWLDADMVWKRVFEPLISEAANVQQRAAEAKAESIKELERERELSKERRLVELQQEEQKKADELAAKNRKAEQRQRHMGSLETLYGQRVEWIETDQVKNRYGGKNTVKRTMVADNCTLKFSGQRVYIILTDGTEIIKARHNVKWESAD